MRTRKDYPAESWVSPKVEVRASSVHGRGMFATSPIKPGETVVIWGGTYVQKEEAERARAQGKLVMQIDDDMFSIEERGDDPTYFMNHSCGPNVWMADAVNLAARRPITRGEELTADYALFEASEDHTMEWECVCGSADCRKRISGRDWRLPELQERYAGHFLPLIGRRISRLNRTS